MGGSSQKLVVISKNINNEIEEKKYDDTNWKEEILSSIEFNQSKFASKLLKDGAKSYMQSIYLGYLYSRWKKLKGYDKYDPKPNDGQCQSSFLEFERKVSQQ